MRISLFGNYIKNCSLNSIPSILGLSQGPELLSRLLTFGLLTLSSMAPAQAIDRATIDLLLEPLEPALFEPDAVLDSAIVTPERISQFGLTEPSLWWTREQFGNSLVTYWLAYQGENLLPGRIDLIVDRQLWNSYNYLQRYAVMSQFGTTAKEFRYNMRVFNAQGELLGAHICQFQPTVTNLNAACSVLLNPYGRGAFRGSAGAIPGASLPTGGDRLPGR